MLPIKYQTMLKEAEGLEQIEKTIDIIKILFPKSFLQSEEDYKNRKFYHAPHSQNWSGTAFTTNNYKRI